MKGQAVVIFILQEQERTNRKFSGGTNLMIDLKIA
jgi:hypothetical protein